MALAPNYFDIRTRLTSLASRKSKLRVGLLLIAVGLVLLFLLALQDGHRPTLSLLAFTVMFGNMLWEYRESRRASETLVILRHIEEQQSKPQA